MLSDRDTHRTWQLVRSTLYEVLECLVDIQLGIQIISNDIQHIRRLIGTICGLRTFDIHWLLTLYFLNNTMLLVGNNTISKLYVLTEAAYQCLA